MKKHITVFTVGACAVALTVGLVIMTVLVATGSFRYRKTKLIIQTGSASKVFDGTALESKTWNILSGKLSKEHELEVKVKGQQTVVGKSENVAEVVIRDSSGMDVTDEYDIEMKYGELEVIRRKLTFSSESGWKVYDGRSFSNENARLSAGHLASGEIWEAYDFAQPSQAGKHTNSFLVRITNSSDEDVTSNYDITYDPGELTIMFGELVIVTGSDSKEYDGTPLSCDTCYVKSGTLYMGHHMDVTPLGSITMAGLCNNNVRLKIVDSSGGEVTDLYMINYELGTLTITPRKLYIRTNDVTRPYYDVPVPNDWEFLSGNLLEGDKLTVVTDQQVQRESRPGTYDNLVYGYTLKNADGWDVSDCYQVFAQYGVYILTD